MWNIFFYHSHKMLPLLKCQKTCEIPWGSSSLNRLKRLMSNRLIDWNLFSHYTWRRIYRDNSSVILNAVRFDEGCRRRGRRLKKKETRNKSSKSCRSLSLPKVSIFINFCFSNFFNIWTVKQLNHLTMIQRQSI